MVDTLDVAAPPDGYVFLTDAPATTDELLSHQRVADAIATTVFKSTNVRTLGIVGPWGSGKSTIVELLKKVLHWRSDGKARVHVFDAWTHHGEPVRRAFLEDFYAFTRGPAAEDDPLVQRIREVTGRATTTRTEEIPSFTWGGTAIIASLAIAAYGVVQGHKLRAIPWVFAVLSWFPEWVASTLAFTLPTAVILCVAAYRLARIRARLPLVVPLLTLSIVAGFVWLLALHFNSYFDVAGALAAALMTACAAACLYPAPGSSGETTESAQPAESLLGILLTRQHQDKRTKVTGMGIPTAVEFSSLFHDMVAEIPGDAPMVVVIDNLDRLPAEDAKELWSMLRTFFLTRTASTAGKEPTTRHHPVLVVPVAAASVEAMYPEGGALQPAQSFMEKTFDVIFHVPAPILTRWSEYLAHQMEAVLGPDGRRWAPCVAELLDASFLGKDDTPQPESRLVTPRRINALVNLMTSYWMQLDGRDIPFATVAHYCINKVIIDANVIAALANTSAPISAFDQEWQRGVAALHYGVDTADAAEVLLTRPIEEAFANRRYGDLSRILKIRGSAAVVRRVVIDYGSRGGLLAAVILNAAHTLAAAGEPTEGTWVQTWTRLVSLLPSVVPWRRLTDTDSADLRELIAHAPDSRAAIKAVHGALSTMDPSENASADAFVQLWRWIDTHHDDALDVIGHIAVPFPAGAFVDIASVLHDRPHILGRLTPAQPDGIAEILVADLDSKRRVTVDESDRRLIAVVSSHVDTNWHAYVMKAIEIYSVFSSASMAHAESLGALGTPLLATAILSARDPKIATTVKSAGSATSLVQLFEIAPKLDSWKVFGRAAAILLTTGELKGQAFLTRPIALLSSSKLAESFSQALALGYPRIKAREAIALALHGSEHTPGTIGEILHRVLVQRSAL